MRLIPQFLSRRPNPASETLADLLFSPTAKEQLLGVGSLKLPTLEEQLQDISKVLAHSRSEDYRIWAQEAWAEVLKHMDKILDPKASQEQVNFERGALLSALNLLRVAHLARLSESNLKRNPRSDHAAKSGTSSR